MNTVRLARRMAKFRILYVVLVILVVCSVVASAQQQNRRKKANQQGATNRPRKPVNNNKPNLPAKRGNRNRPNKINKVNNPAQEANTVSHQIPGLGIVRGRTIKSEWSGQNIHQFFDIPYAKGPTGAMRFRAPAKVVPWNGVLKAEKPYYGCPSLGDDYDFELLKSNNVEVEDCLRLSIHTKSVSRISY